MHFFADDHTHTRHSHGTGTVEDNVKAAVQKGLREVAITDHGPASLFGVGVPDLHRFRRIRDEVDAAAARHPEVRVLLGVEANVISLDGELDVPVSLQHEFDIVLAGLHPLVKPRAYGEALRLAAANIVGRFHAGVGRSARNQNTQALIAAVERNRIDIVTHPGYRLSIDTPALARACAANGTALEISARHAHTNVGYIQAAAAEGVEFAVGSDAHAPARVGELAAGGRLAEAAGLDPDRVRNAAAGGRDGARA